MFVLNFDFTKSCSKYLKTQSSPLRILVMEALFNLLETALTDFRVKHVK